MRFSTILSVLACGAMTLAAAIAPDSGLLHRSNDAITEAVTTLSVGVNVLLSDLGECEDSKCTNNVCLEISAAVDSCTSDLKALVGVLDPKLADAVANIFVDISAGLNDHKSKCAGNCGDLAVYAKVDSSLSLWLRQLEVCIIGILGLVIASVTKLLAGVVALLQGLGLTLCLGIFTSN